MAAPSGAPRRRRRAGEKLWDEAARRCPTIPGSCARNDPLNGDLQVFGAIYYVQLEPFLLWSGKSAKRSAYVYIYISEQSSFSRIRGGLVFKAHRLVYHS